MNVGKITAKLRDAVPVCFMVEGDEIIRFKNIDMPEALKDLEMKDFGFSIQGDGRIDFNIYFEPGILPETFPEKRARRHRTPKLDAAIPEQVDEATEIPESTQAAPEPTEATDAPTTVFEIMIPEPPLFATIGPATADMATIPDAPTDTTLDAATDATTETATDNAPVVDMDIDALDTAKSKPGRPAGRKNYGK